MSIRRGCCCGGCYSLTDCDTAAVTYTQTDLSAYVGDVVRIGEDCYTVASSTTCTDPAAVVVGDEFANCTACEDHVDDCCIVGCPAPASPCDGCHPIIRVTFTGVSSCGCSRSHFNGAEYHATDFDVTEINASFTLDDIECRDGGTVARWIQNTLPDTTEDATVWVGLSAFNDDCSNALQTASGTGKLTIWLDRTDAGWKLQVWQVGVGISQQSLKVFDGFVAEAADGDCMNIPDISNDLVAGDCAKQDTAVFRPLNYGARYATFGGTASLEVCPQ